MPREGGICKAQGRIEGNSENRAEINSIARDKLED